VIPVLGEAQFTPPESLRPLENLTQFDSSLTLIGSSDSSPDGFTMATKNGRIYFYMYERLIGDAGGYDLEVAKALIDEARNSESPRQIPYIIKMALVGGTVGGILAAGGNLIFGPIGELLHVATLSYGSYAWSLKPEIIGLMAAFGAALGPLHGLDSGVLGNSYRGIDFLRIGIAKFMGRVGSKNEMKQQVVESTHGYSNQTWVSRRSLFGRETESSHSQHQAIVISNWSKVFNFIEILRRYDSTAHGELFDAFIANHAGPPRCSGVIL
jgi:hypothetical protein